MFDISGDLLRAQQADDELRIIDRRFVASLCTGDVEAGFGEQRKRRLLQTSRRQPDAQDATFSFHKCGPFLRPRREGREENAHDQHSVKRAAPRAHHFGVVASVNPSRLASATVFTLAKSSRNESMRMTSQSSGRNSA